MRPVNTPRPPSGEEAAGSHLAACAHCGAANGVTASACWRCGAAGWRRPLERAAHAGAAAASAGAPKLHEQHPRPTSPLPLSMPLPLRPSLAMTPTLEDEPTEQDLRALALREPARSEPMSSGQRAAQVRRSAQPLRLGSIAAAFGGLGVVILLAALMLADRYHGNQIGTGWAPAVPHREPEAPGALQVDEMIERTPPAAGPTPLPSAQAATGAPPVPADDAPRRPPRDDMPAFTAAPLGSPAPPAASTPWACTPQVVALGLCTPAASATATP